MLSERARMPGRSASLTRLARQVGPAALEGFEDEGLVASTIPLKLRGLSSAGAGTDAASGTRWSDGRRTVSRSSPGSSLDHRLGVSEPLLLLAQMRHGRSGQGVERASATLAAESQQPVRAAPADDLATRAMRQPRLSTRSTLVVPSASSVRLARRFPCEGAAKSSGAAAPLPPSLALAGFPALLRAQARDRHQPTRKVLSPHRITSTRRRLTETIDNAIRADNGIWFSPTGAPAQRPPPLSDAPLSDAASYD